MKKLFRIGTFVLLLILCGACSRHKVIPDKELAQIFRDAFLTNAYINMESIRVDSLNIYEPIFARYGYTTDDVQYTIGNFSKRKSARLGDVVEKAIELLEIDGKLYNKEVSILDTIDNVARRAFSRTIYSDSLIRVRAVRDTSRLRLSFDVQPGEYELQLKYLVDSLDQNQDMLRGSVWLEKRDSSKFNASSALLRRNTTESFTRRFVVDTTIRRLRVSFVEFREKPRKPSVTITDFKIKYIPPAEQAVDSLYEQQLNLRIFADEFLRAAIPTDSL